MTSIFLIIFLTYYSKYIINILIDKNGRADIKKKNKKLDKLRKIPIKSIKDQKKFLDIRYPKKKKEKYTLKKFGKLIFSICLYLMLFFLFRWMVGMIEFILNFWIVLVIIFAGPYIINKILKRYNLEKNY